MLSPVTLFALLPARYVKRSASWSAEAAEVARVTQLVGAPLDALEHGPAAGGHRANGSSRRGILLRTGRFRLQMAESEVREEHRICILAGALSQMHRWLRVEGVPSRTNIT